MVSAHTLFATQIDRNNASNLVCLRAMLTMIQPNLTTTPIVNRSHMDGYKINFRVFLSIKEKGQRFTR